MAQTASYPHLVSLALLGWLLASGCTPEAVYNRSVDELTLVSYNRIYPAFAETSQVVLGKAFPLGDADNRARVNQYLPEFEIDTKGRISSRSARSDNPAVRLEVLRGRMRQNFAWAFLSAGEPHFRARDEFAFRVIKIKFKDGHVLSESEGAGQ